MIFIVMVGNYFTFDAEVLSAKAIPLVIDVEMVNSPAAAELVRCAQNLESKLAN